VQRKQTSRRAPREPGVWPRCIILCPRRTRSNNTRSQSSRLVGGFLNACGETEVPGYGRRSEQEFSVTKDVDTVTRTLARCVQHLCLLGSVAGACRKCKNVSRECGTVNGCIKQLCQGTQAHHHHQITKLSHSINAIGLAPPGRQKEGAPLHCVCNYYAHPKLAQDTQKCS
jgi:hypothetical protein